MGDHGHPVPDRLAGLIDRRLAVTAGGDDPRAVQLAVLVDRKRPARELRSMQEITTHSIAEIRDFLSGKEVCVLTPGTLIESLKQDLGFLRDGLGVHAILDNEPEELNLPPDAERELYYIIREGVMNIAKHAHASKAAVLLRVADRQIRGAVEDDGVGFEAEQRASNGTLGLRSMEERVRKLGGSFDVQAGVGKGTRLSFTIPLPA